MRLDQEDKLRILHTIEYCIVIFIVCFSNSIVRDLKKEVSTYLQQIEDLQNQITMINERIDNINESDISSYETEKMFAESIVDIKDTLTDLKDDIEELESKTNKYNNNTNNQGTKINATNETYIGTMSMSHYAPIKSEGGAKDRKGNTLVPYESIAIPKSLYKQLPYGTKIKIVTPNGQVYYGKAVDTGSALDKYNRIDRCVPTGKEAQNLGVIKNVKIYKIDA